MSPNQDALGARHDQQFHTVNSCGHFAAIPELDMHPGQLQIFASTTTIATWVPMTLIVLLCLCVAWNVAATILRLRESKRRQSEKDTLEKQLEEANRRADAAERARSTFLANMSHEVRTPMNGILGLSRVMLDCPLEDNQRENLQLLVRAGESLLQILNDVLEFAAIDAGYVQLYPCSFEPCEIAESVVADCDARAKQRNNRVSIEISDRVPRIIESDATRIRQVLLNLVSNAVKFTESGEVRIEVDATCREGNLAQVAFRVIDTGIGIPEDCLATIFEPFVQADGSRTRCHGGSGLGLAVSQKLTNLLSGELQVTSEPGKGSTFTLTVPCTIVDPSPSRRPEAPVNAPTTTMPVAPVIEGTPRIMVVDDNVVNQKLMVNILQRRGFEVVIAGNGAEALSLADSVQLDVILMDCQMPILDGYDAARKLREQKRTSRSGAPIPIIALTANSMAEDRERCKEAGMDGFLAKPLNVRQLFSELDQYLGSTPQLQTTSAH